MNKEQFDALLDEVCTNGALNKEEVLDKLADYLNAYFRNNTDLKKRETIDRVKIKIVTSLYDMRDHSYVGRGRDIAEKFGLDRFETTVMQDAANELEAAGHLEGNEHYTKLTNEGIAFYGNILN